MVAGIEVSNDLNLHEPRPLQREKPVN